MKDIATLRQMIHPRTWVQLGVFLLCCSIGSAWASRHFLDTPWLFSAFLAAFFLLPLIGAKLIRRNIEMALEAYDGNQSVGAQARWLKESDGEGYSWAVELDLGTQGKWTLELGGERPVAEAKKDLPATVTVWLHPETHEPRLLKSEQGLFYPKKIRAHPD